MFLPLMCNFPSAWLPCTNKPIPALKHLFESDDVSAMHHLYRHINFVMNSLRPEDFIIRQLPNSSDHFEWMYGLEIFLGLRPFDSIRHAMNFDKTDQSNRNNSTIRPRCVGVLLGHVILYGALHFLCHIDWFVGIHRYLLRIRKSRWIY